MVVTAGLHKAVQDLHQQKAILEKRMGEIAVLHRERLRNESNQAMANRRHQQASMVTPLRCILRSIRQRTVIRAFHHWSRIARDAAFGGVVTSKTAKLSFLLGRQMQKRQLKQANAFKRWHLLACWQIQQDAVEKAAVERQAVRQKQEEKLKMMEWQVKERQQAADLVTKQLVRLEDKCARAGVSNAGVAIDPLAESMGQLLTVRLDGALRICLPICSVGAVDVVEQLHQVFLHYESQYQNQFCNNSEAHEEMSKRESMPANMSMSISEHMRDISYWAGCRDCLKRFAEDCKLVGSQFSMEQLQSALSLACAKSKRGQQRNAAELANDWGFQLFLRGLVELARLKFPLNPPAVGMKQLLHHHLQPVARVIAQTYSAVQGSAPFANHSTTQASMHASLPVPQPIIVPTSMAGSIAGESAIDYGPAIDYESYNGSPLSAGPSSFSHHEHRHEHRPNGRISESAVEDRQLSSTDHRLSSMAPSLNEDGFDVWSQGDASAVMGGSSPIGARQGASSHSQPPTLIIRCSPSSHTLLYFFPRRAPSSAPGGRGLVRRGLVRRT
jgi:hypothetical protein